MARSQPGFDDSRSGLDLLSAHDEGDPRLSRQDENACKVLEKMLGRGANPGILQLIFMRRGKRGETMERSKREFIKAGAGVAALAMMPRALAQWQPSQRYPDPLIKIVDPSFARYRLALAQVERFASGMRWCGRPGWVGGWRVPLLSGLPHHRIMKLA